MYELIDVRDTPQIQTSKELGGPIGKGLKFSEN